MKSNKIGIFSLLQRMLA